ncbi:MAG TPA: hypothetical protein VK158_04670 [Acidobacteriota bacterium]|nr:hypothetical protein [Acidobacteriota bacterium]
MPHLTDFCVEEIEGKKFYVFRDIGHSLDIFVAKASEKEFDYTPARIQVHSFPETGIFVEVLTKQSRTNIKTTAYIANILKTNQTGIEALVYNTHILALRTPIPKYAL